MELVFTGLRVGEKLHECLLGELETDQRPVHRLISHVDIPPLDPADLRGLDLLDGSASASELIARMQELATGACTDGTVGSISDPTGAGHGCDSRTTRHWAADEIIDLTDGRSTRSRLDGATS